MSAHSLMSAPLKSKIFEISAPRPAQKTYQAFCGLKHRNLLEAGSFPTRKLNQSASCLMLQFKGKNTLKLPSDSNFK